MTTADRILNENICELPGTWTLSHYLLTLSAYNFEPIHKHGKSVNNNEKQVLKLCSSASNKFGSLPLGFS